MSHALRQLDAPAALEQLRAGSAWLVDVRERDEVARAAFDAPNVLVLPLSEFVRRFEEALPRDAELILACAAGVRSAQAAQFLEHHGYQRVANLTGGLNFWHMHGLPVSFG